MKRALDLETLAKRILSGQCRNIVFLTGAGVSVAAGIPDFRSPGGMYDTLQPDLLTATSAQRQQMKDDPTHVVSFALFRQTQLPYLELRRPFILGLGGNQWQPTLIHALASLFHKKELLRRIYTQNIDGLDYKTGVPSSKIISVHGSLMTVSCEGCGNNANAEEFREKVRTQIKDIYDSGDIHAPLESTPIECLSCHKPLVKPNTVLYGRSLPKEFFTNIEEDTEKSDLLIIAGTSLTVGPANRVPSLMRNSVPRLVVNKEAVGKEVGMNYGPDSSDILLEGSCDRRPSMIHTTSSAVVNRPNARAG
eukprot:CFRG0049T1